MSKLPYLYFSLYSQNNCNNLIIHITNEKKDDLKPQKTSLFLSEI
jgi:hypothetical protein